MIESNRPIFSYFDRQLGRPDWESKRVLDFGGNAGHVLMDPSSTIDPRNYCCIDVLESAIREGRRRFSEARWIFYDRFNPGYNPHGQPGLAVPETDGEFDYILAYSVFTHTSKAEMIELVDELRRRLSPDGTLAFSFLDPSFDPLCTHAESLASENGNLRYYLNLKNVRRVEIEPLLERASGARWCTVVNGGCLHIDDEDIQSEEFDELRRLRADGCLKALYDVYYTPEYLQTVFPDALVKPPVNGDRQHCCILSRHGS